MKTDVKIYVARYCEFYYLQLFSWNCCCVFMQLIIISQQKNERNMKYETCCIRLPTMCELILKVKQNLDLWILNTWYWNCSLMCLNTQTTRFVLIWEKRRLCVIVRIGWIKVGFWRSNLDAHIFSWDKKDVVYTVQIGLIKDDFWLSNFWVSNWVS